MLHADIRACIFDSPTYTVFGIHRPVSGVGFTSFELVYSYPGALIFFLPPCYMFSVVHPLLPLLTFFFV
jgi:hypothetical protein